MKKIVSELDGKIYHVLDTADLVEMFDKSKHLVLVELHSYKTEFGFGIRGYISDVVDYCETKLEHQGTIEDKMLAGEPVSDELRAYTELRDYFLDCEQIVPYPERDDGDTLPYSTVCLSNSQYDAWKKDLLSDLELKNVMKQTLWERDKVESAK